MLRLLAQTASLLAGLAPAPELASRPTSATGALALAPAALVAEPAPPSSSSSFLARAAAPDVIDDGDRRREFRLGRAGLEIAGAMALGAGWYQSEIELNKLDFDFDRTWKDQTRRIFSRDGYRFDDNDRVLNVGHAFVGAYYHQFARQNGGGMLSALAFDFITSSTWELFVEHREVFSLNDTVMTTFGAVPIGESLFQLGDYFGRSRPTVVNRVLMGIFSPAHATSLLWGDSPETSSMGYDGRGLARDATRSFSLATGAGRALALEGAGGGAGPGGASSTQPWQGELRLDLELINFPSYGRAATRRRSTDGGEITRVKVDYTGSSDDLRNLSIVTRTSLWGLYVQDTKGAADGSGLRGHSIFLGSATAFDLSVEDRRTFNDFIAALHLIGPAADVTLHRDRLALRMAADITPDFAMVRPFALDPARSAADMPGTKSTLGKHSYYYAFGVATNARLEASYRALRAGASVEWNHYDSIEGLDRHQHAYTSPTGRFHPAISDDVQASDQRLKLRVYGDSALPLTGVRVGASLDYGQRSGDLAGETRAEEDLRLSLLASFAL